VTQAIKKHSASQKNKPRVLLDVEAKHIDDVLEQVTALLVEEGTISDKQLPPIKKLLDRRGDLGPDSLEHGVAIIHEQSDEGVDLNIIVRLSQALDAVTASDGIPLKFIWIMISDKKTHDAMSTAVQFSKLLAEESFRSSLAEVDQIEEFEAIWSEEREDEYHFEHIPDELRPTGRFAGGIVADIKRRAPLYVSDFTDGLTSKSLASVFFLFFACLAPAIAFGGLLEVQTGGAVGVTEMIVATAICGVTYALLSGQPLTILGSTGPVIVFMGLLYPLCVQYNIPYLPTLACVGLWTMLFLLILAFIDACSWIRYFTRFTDDTFAALISLIFIYEAGKKMLGGFSPNAEGIVEYDVALLSLLLGVGTFYVAISLSNMRSGVYLRRNVREFLADFGPTIAIVLMTLLAYQLSVIKVESLDVPEILEPSSYVLSQEAIKEHNLSDELQGALRVNPSLITTKVERLNDIIPENQPSKIRGDLINLKGRSEILSQSRKRGWLVNPLDAPQWVWWMSIIPAILLSILLYLDQNITVRLVNHSQYKLKKKPGYHLDLSIVALLVGVCSLLGLPWMVAATVRSLNHVRSLTIVEDHHGEEVVVGTVETRLTGVLVHLAVGASLLILSVLKLIPMAALFGLFLFMGVGSMKGNQLFERLKLWFMDPDRYPSTYYLRAVPLKKVHLFTLIQVLCLSVLWAIKASMFAILFPLFIAFLVPIRLGMGRFFDASNLALLDTEEEPDEEQFRDND
jgi:mannitol/fructose-specific phosphotransferase system IIA component (Ntr-type)